MSKIKNCDDCGLKISIRQMPHGRWVAFDVNSNTPHKHRLSKKKAIKTATKKNSKEIARMNMSLDEVHIIDRFGNLYELDNIPFKKLDLTPKNLKKTFIKLISEKKIAQISYIDRSGDRTNREIYPLKLMEDSLQVSNLKSVKIAGFCKLRNDYRSFLLSSIDGIKVMSKIPDSFISNYDSLEELEKRKIFQNSNHDNKYTNFSDDYSSNISNNVYTNNKKRAQEENFSWLWWVVAFLVMLFMLI